MFLSVCHRHQCMDYISVCYDSGEWLLCEIWCIETTTEDHHHRLSSSLHIDRHGMRMRKMRLYRSIQ